MIRNTSVATVRKPIVEAEGFLIAKQVNHVRQASAVVEHPVNPVDTLVLRRQGFGIWFENQDGKMFAAAVRPRITKTIMKEPRRRRHTPRWRCCVATFGALES